MIRKILAVAALVVLMPFAANADLTTNMVGDARVGVPDNLVVNVSVVIDGDGIATVTVDLSPMTSTHPDVKMQNFFFNMDGAYADYAVAIVSPGTWSITTGENAQASGGADFMFEYNDSGTPPNNVNVTTPLVFTIQLAGGGGMTDALFTGANTSSSDVGSGQIGAHLQSLNGGCSGFVWGVWEGSSEGPVGDGSERVCDSTSVPEPGTLGLLGLGLLGLAARRRRIA